MRTARLARAVRLSEATDAEVAEESGAVGDSKDDAIRLAEAGALQEMDEEEGRVERDHDVLSEPPEIDTSRAETPPRKFKKGFVTIVIAMCAINIVLVVLVSCVLALGVSTPECEVDKLARQIALLNNTFAELVEAVEATVLSCT